MSQATPTGHQALPAPIGVRNSATRVVASTVGVYGGLIGLEHGIGETLQGNVAPNSILINAIGPQANSVWQGREPALTLIPNFFVTGVLTIIVSLIVVIWAAAFVQRKYGGLVLILRQKARSYGAKRLLNGSRFEDVLLAVHPQSRYHLG